MSIAVADGQMKQKGYRGIFKQPNVLNLDEGVYHPSISKRLISGSKLSEGNPESRGGF